MRKSITILAAAAAAAVLLTGTSGTATAAVPAPLPLGPIPATTFTAFDIVHAVTHNYQAPDQFGWPQWDQVAGLPKASYTSTYRVRVRTMTDATDRVPAYRLATDADRLSGQIYYSTHGDMDPVGGSDAYLICYHQNPNVWPAEYEYRVVYAKSFSNVTNANVAPMVAGMDLDGPGSFNPSSMLPAGLSVCAY